MTAHDAARDALRRGNAAYASGQFAEARAAYDEALGHVPDLVEALNNRGIVRQRQGDADGAVEDFDRALARVAAGQRGELLKSRGAAHRARGDLVGACDDFDAYLGLHPAASVHNIRGVTRLERGDEAGAGADFDAALGIDPEYAEALLNRATLRLGQDHPAAAQADCDAALRLAPTLVPALNLRSLCRHNQGDFKGALADADRAVELDAGIAESHHNRGIARLAIGEFTVAITDFDTAIRLKPDLCVAYLGRANARYHQRDMAGLFDYRAAFRLDPQQAAQTLVRVFRNDLRRDPGAVFADCQRHLQANPDDFLALVRRGLTLLLSGQDAEAQRDFDHFLALNPAGRTNLERMIAEARRVQAAIGNRP